jgi:hypothetical protein
MAKSLYPLKPLLSSLNFLKLFDACVVSLLKYMIVILGSASKHSISIIDRCIRRSARIILSKSKYDRILSDIYSNIAWFLPSDSYKYFSLCTLFHIIRHGKVPFFNSIVIFNSDRASHRTRSIHDIYVPNIRRNC